MPTRTDKSGLPPGSLVHIGPEPEHRARITVFDYDEKKVKEFEAKQVDDCFPLRDSHTVSWINIYGVHDEDVIRKLGDHFGLHSLLLEDIMNTEQRPKLDEYDGHAFLVMRMMNASGKDDDDEQVSIVLGPTWVLCFQEQIGDVFDNIRERIRGGKRIRTRGPDYLAYTLMDTVVDNYFSVLERLGERIEDTEEEILVNADQKLLTEIQHLKRDTTKVRRAVWPLRDIAAHIGRGESKHFGKDTLVYLRDVHDHTVQVIDTLQTQREQISGLLDIYMSSQSNKMNEIMKVLTIIATIFIPLTFIAGVYGMNFRHMPEIEWRYGYYITWGIMIVVAAALLWFFRKRDWI